MKRGFMKKICVLFVLVLLSVSVLPAVSAPNYDERGGAYIIWDPDGYNAKLAGKLQDDFDKKYCKRITPDFTECNYPDGAISQEITGPYLENHIPAPGILETQKILEKFRN